MTIQNYYYYLCNDDNNVQYFGCFGLIFTLDLNIYYYQNFNNDSHNDYDNYYDSKIEIDDYTDF